MSPLAWIAMSLLGGVGALARFALDGLVAERVPSEFPVGTLAVNLSGTVLLGLVTGLAFSDEALLIVGTGLIGSYTTFSTWMFETHRLGTDSRLALLGLNVVVSLGAGVAAAALGRLIGGAL